jgi:arginase
MKLEMIGVPHTSAAKPGGIATAIEVLRSSGLADALRRAGDVHDGGDLELETGAGVRGRTGLLNEEALARLVDATCDAVAGSLGRGHRPLLVGGDCPVLLGALSAGRATSHAAGLLLVDGHEDAWPPERSSTGEASDSEVAIALGFVSGLPATLDTSEPLLAPERIAMIGPRDRGEITDAGLESLDRAVAVFTDDIAVQARGAEASAQEALAALEGAADSFWLHVDLDVLRTDEFPAVDYPQPGGLSWGDVRTIATAAMASRHCYGCSVVIYNPDLDPERTSAGRVVRFLSDLANRDRCAWEDSNLRPTA